MKITVINGTEKQGVTYRLKEIFLERFRGSAEITEYYLPRDCPGFCSGCISCFMKGENTCKDAQYIQKIESSLLEADLIVMTSPVYVFHATGAMKAVLDHLGYRWMNHRPAREMFGKRAVVITQCIGMGAGSTVKDMKHSLSWWGVSKIYAFKGTLMSEIVWDKLPEKKRAELAGRMEKLAERLSRVDYSRPAGTGLGTKIKFYACRIIQKAVYSGDTESLDAEYWKAQGWLDGERPWKAG